MIVPQTVFQGEYQVVSKRRKIAAWVNVEEDTIVDTAPILKVFIGQHVSNLICWLGTESRMFRLEDVDV